MGAPRVEIPARAFAKKSKESSLAPPENLVTRSAVFSYSNSQLTGVEVVVNVIWGADMLIFCPRKFSNGF